MINTNVLDLCLICLWSFELRATCFFLVMWCGGSIDCFLSLDKVGPYWIFLSFTLCGFRRVKDASCCRGGQLLLTCGSHGWNNLLGSLSNIFSCITCSGINWHSFLVFGQRIHASFGGLLCSLLRNKMTIFLPLFL